MGQWVVITIGDRDGIGTFFDQLLADIPTTAPGGVPGTALIWFWLRLKGVADIRFDPIDIDEQEVDFLAGGKTGAYDGDRNVEIRISRG